MNTKATLRTCRKGHKYYKSSDCPTCPTCEEEKTPSEGFLSAFSAPARRALEHHGVLTVEELARRTRKEILSYHGMGKASLPAMEKALAEKGLQFRTES